MARRKQVGPVEPVIQQRRDFVVPGCFTTIQSDEQPLAVEQLLGIVFSLAGSNPGASVEFWIKVTPPENEAPHS